MTTWPSVCRRESSQESSMAEGQPAVRTVVVHNAYGSFSGEEAVVEGTKRLLRDKGHDVVEFARSSAEIGQMSLGKLRAFFSGVYSGSARRRMRELLTETRPDLVHVHNVYPLISPSVLVECRRAGVPVVMTVHNYRLVCPNGLHMVNGQVCERCCGGREYWCILRNCTGEFLKSVGYALRNWVARKWRLFLDNVTLYAALTEFQRQRLIAAGFPRDRIQVIPNMAAPIKADPETGLGHYVGYVGRISPEKGLPLLMAAARNCLDVVFKAAGTYERMPNLPQQAPANFEFLGHLNAEALAEFYRACRIVVLPSTWFEGFPMVLAEAMLRGKPIVCSRIGGLPEIVDDGVTGLLFEPGNVEELAEKVRCLWDSPDLCRQMGEAGRQKALREYSPDRYYERLMALYQRAIELAPGGPATRLSSKTRAMTTEV